LGSGFGATAGLAAIAAPPAAMATSAPVTVQARTRRLWLSVIPASPAP
jgi:hypothetical protein